jgi:hypothetical protein
MVGQWLMPCNNREWVRDEGNGQGKDGKGNDGKGNDGNGGNGGYDGNGGNGGSDGSDGNGGYDGNGGHYDINMTRHGHSQYVDMLMTEVRLMEARPDLEAARREPFLHLFLPGKGKDGTGKDGKGKDGEDFSHMHTCKGKGNDKGNVDGEGKGENKGKTGGKGKGHPNWMPSWAKNGVSHTHPGSDQFFSRMAFAASGGKCGKHGGDKGGKGNMDPDGSEDEVDPDRTNSRYPVTP